MKNIEKVVIPVIIIVIITMLGIYYISKEYEKQQAEKRAQEIKETMASNTEEVVSSDDLVYECIAMLVGKDEEEHKLKFITVESEKLFELEYSGKTPILGKHGNSLTLAEIPLGEILNVSYSVHSKELYELRISSEAWTFTDVTKFDINTDEGRMDIAGSTYRLPKTAIVSYRDELATFMDVTNVDTLTVKGYGRKVCSVIVDRGHGYVRLLNDSYFEGGWIEIGQEIIKQVTEEMLIPVPEGDYHVRLTNRGYAAEEDVTVERDKEATIDLSKVDIKEVAIGHVEFSIIPDYAQLFVDGQMTDYEERVPLEYGVHGVHVELAGYKSVDTNIRINDRYANIDIILEAESDTSSTAKTGSSSSSTTTFSSSTETTAALPGAVNTTAFPILSGTVTPAPGSTGSSISIIPATSSSSDSGSAVVISDTRKMYVESPEGAEVFIDGIYVGIAPISFIKPEKGSHVVTLSKNGYVTKSYTVSVSDDDRDVTLSFSELLTQQ
ncbi:MAG: PEGA domain-containing protein [Lachnospiraceae bacterium]|nr:PEGA domain-containing protein [Lachnospiraceae bacterium]